MEWKHDYQSYIAGKSQVFLLNYGWNYVELWRGGKGQIISSNYALHRILEMFTTIIWTRGRGKGVGDQGGRGKGGIELRYFTERERELQLQIPSLTTSSRTRRSSPNPTSISTHPSPSLQQLVSGTWPLLGSHVMEQSSIERAEMLWSFQIYLKSFDVLFSGNIENIPLVLVLMWSWCIEVTRAD